jgi:hypothetical protein
MSIRDNLITALTANLSGHSSFGISSELPYSTADTPLYLKNLRTVYVDELQEDVTELFNCLDNNDVMQTETTCTVYLATDAKNQPTDIDTLVANIQLARNGVTAATKSSEVTTELDADVITYNIEFNFITV